MAVHAARVFVHGVPVGALTRLNEDEDFIFEFDPAWIEDPDAPTLGQLFIDRRPRPIKTSALPCWFAHLLPGGAWRRHLKRWARLALRDDEDDDFTLLVALGHDLPGALTPGSFDGIAHNLQRDAHEVRRWVREAWDRALQSWSQERLHLGFTAAEQARLDTHLARMRLVTP